LGNTLVLALDTRKLTRVSLKEDYVGKADCHFPKTVGDIYAERQIAGVFPSILET